MFAGGHEFLVELGDPDGGCVELRSGCEGHPSEGRPREGAMRRDEILAILRSEAPRLRAEFGVKSLALFGSVARDEAGPGSDAPALLQFSHPARAQ